VAEHRHVRTRAAQILGRPGPDRSLELRGPGWGEVLQVVLEALTHSERLALYAVPLDDDAALPVRAETMLGRARTPWLPGLLNDGGMFPHFQPIVDLGSGGVHGREALMRGEYQGMALTGGQIVKAANDHDALFHFDAQARTTALAAGLPVLPPGETLYVNFTPTAIYDPAVCLRTTWAVARRLGMSLDRVCFEVVETEAFPDIDFLAEILSAYRAQGASVALDDLGSGNSSLLYLRELRPDVVKLDKGLVAGVDADPPRRRMLTALVDYAHALDIRVIAEGIETAAELAVCQAAGIDFGQGWYLGRPAAGVEPVAATIVTGLARAA
jgi:EAL domain-containing protein (putative c-di-GMP-specific phosphodiesterase class I)